MRLLNNLSIISLIFLGACSSKTTTVLPTATDLSDLKQFTIFIDGQEKHKIEIASVCQKPSGHSCAYYSDEIKVIGPNGNATYHKYQYSVGVDESTYKFEQIKGSDAFEEAKKSIIEKPIIASLHIDAKAYLAAMQERKKKNLSSCTNSRFFSKVEKSAEFDNAVVIFVKGLFGADHSGTSTTLKLNLVKDKPLDLVQLEHFSSGDTPSGARVINLVKHDLSDEFARVCKEAYKETISGYYEEQHASKMLDDLYHANLTMHDHKNYLTGGQLYQFCKIEMENGLYL